MGYSKAEVSEIVRRVLMKTLQDSAAGTGDATHEADSTPLSSAGASRIIGEAEIQAASAGADLEIQPGALITPLARQMAMERGIRLVERSAASVSGKSAPARVPAISPAGEKRVAPWRRPWRGLL